MGEPKQVKNNPSAAGQMAELLAKQALENGAACSKAIFHNSAEEPEGLVLVAFGNPEVAELLAAINGVEDGWGED